MLKSIISRSLLGRKSLLAPSIKAIEVRKNKLDHSYCVDVGRGKVPCPKKEKPAKAKPPSVDQILAEVSAVKAGNPTPEVVTALASKMTAMPVKDLVALKGKLGVKASGKKSVLAEKIAKLGTAPSKPTPMAMVDKIRALKAGTPTADDIKTIAKELESLTVKDLTLLKADLGIKASGIKPELVRKIAERAFAVPKEKARKPDKVKKPDKVEPVVEPPPPPPVEKVAEPVKDTDTVVPPPKPGFTGTDTLGRHWQDGKLVPGEPDDPAPSHESIKIDPTRKLIVKDLARGNIPKLTTENIADLKLFHLSPESRYRFGINDYDASKNPDAVVRLQKAGILKPMTETWARGAQELTDEGALALASVNLPNEVSDPTTIKSTDQLGGLYGLAGKEVRKKILTHFGLNTSLAEGSEGRELDGYDFRNLLLNAIERFHNPNPIADRVRKNKDIHNFVASLANLSTDVENGPEMNKVRDGMSKLEKEIDTLFPSGMVQLYNIKRSVEHVEFLLTQKNTRNKRQLRTNLERLKKAGEEWTTLRDSKQGIRDNGRKKRLDSVSKILRTRVKNPQEIRVSHSPEVDELNQGHMKEGMNALEGVIEKGLGEVQPFKTYVDKGNERAHCTRDNRINFHGSWNGPGVAIHEMMHGIEHDNPDIATAVQEFRRYRVKDEKGIHLNEKFPGGRYEDHEVGYKDDFDKGMDESSGYYTGKYYDRTGTEILTMGVQKLYEDPTRFCAGDPEFASFIVGILDGTFRNKPIPEE